MEAHDKPRMTGGSHPLPFEKLAPLEFERLCLWLVRREGYERAEHLGEAGSEQGRDVVAWKDGHRVVFQCKRVQAFTQAVAKREIEKLRALPIEDQPLELVFMVSRTVSADLRAALRTAWGDKGSCQFWAGNELDERVKRHPEILREFFQLGPEVGEDRATKRRTRLNWGIALSLLGIVLTVATWRCPRSSKPVPPPKPTTYVVRIQVLDSHGRALEGSKIRMSTQNEPQQTPDGWWEVEIPAAKVPANGRVTVWAEHEEWDENDTVLHLGTDPNPRLEIRLKEPESWIRGRVTDAVGRGLPGARVTRQDGASGAVTTDAEGKFGLKTSLPKGRRVRLAAELASFVPVETFCFTESDSCSLELETR